MAESGGSVVWNLDVDDRKFTSGLRKAKADTEKFGSDIDKAGASASSRLQAHLGGMSDFALLWAKRMVISGTVAAGAFSLFGLKTAGDLESARQGFITLLGSAEKADSIINQIKEDAKKTPFELKGLIQANQQLTTITKNGLQSESILLNVGKALAASGKGQAELDRIILNLQQIGLTGKITELDIKQFGTVGVNILELLADQYGVTTAEASEMVKNSDDAFGDLEKAFAKAGGSGGKFEKAFTNQAGTFNQLVSNMKDSITIFASDFVKATGIFDVSKRAIGGFTKAITDNREAIVSTVVRGFTVMRNVITQIINVVVEVARTLNQLFGPSIKALVNTIVTSLLPSLIRLYNALQPALTTVLKIVAVIVGTVVVVALWLFINVLNVAIKTLGLIVSSISNVISWAGNLAGAVKNMVAIIVRSVAGFGSLLYNAGLSLIRGLINGIRDMANALRSGVKFTADGIGRFFAGAGHWLYDTGKALIQGLINGIKGMAGGTVDAVKGVVNGALNKAKNLLGIHSPSRVFKEVGKNIGLGLAQGISASQRNVQASMAGLASGLGIDSGFSVSPVISGSGGFSGSTSKSTNVSVSLNMNGVMARSRGDLRDIAKDMITAVNEELSAKGVDPIGGGAV